MAGELSIDERAAVEARQKSAREAKVDAETLAFAGNALRALADPSLTTKGEIFGRLVELQEGEAVALDRTAEVGIEQKLDRAVTHVDLHGKQAEGIAKSAVEMAAQIEQNGLPDTPPPPPGPPPEGLGHPEGGGLGILTR